VSAIIKGKGYGFLKEQNHRSHVAIIELFLAKIMGGCCEPIHPEALATDPHIKFLRERK
jgi:hypothetical protein